MTVFANRYFGLDQESSYGTGAGSYVWGEVDDESLAPSYELMDRADMSRYATAKSVSGKETSAGGANFAIMADDFMGNVLKGFYPTDSKTGAGPQYTHTFAENGTLPSFSAKVGRTDFEHTYTGLVMDRLSFSASLNEYAMASCDMLGKMESAPTSSMSTPSFADSLDAMHFANIDVFFKGNASASQYVKSFDLELTLNRDGDNACGLGSTTYTRAPPAQLRELSGSIEFATNIVDNSAVLRTPDYDEPEWKNLVSGSTDRTYNPAGSTTALKITLSDTSTTPNTLTINIFKVVWESPESSVSGRDTQTMKLPFKALYDAGGANQLSQIVLVNTQSAAY